MSSRAALLIGKIAHARTEWEALSTAFTLKASVPEDLLHRFMKLTSWKEYEDGSRRQFIQDCQEGKYDDVVAIYRSNASTTVTGPFDQELVACLPLSLQYICHNGAGYDNIDVEACSQRGILITSTPVAVDNATADIAIFLMIGALRQAHKPLSGVRDGNWRGKFTLGHDPNGKILGILGMGGIGGEVAIRARAFGMKIHYHNRNPLPLQRAKGATYVTFDELISQSDVISLNLSLTKSTKHIIGAPEFAKMKDGVVIINTARGALIDERALVDALASAEVYSVGLDVYENEPKVEDALLTNSNVMLLPHIGTATYETQREMELLVLENLRAALAGAKLITPIPEQSESLKVTNGFERRQESAIYAK